MLAAEAAAIPEAQALELLDELVDRRPRTLLAWAEYCLRETADAIALVDPVAPLVDSLPTPPLGSA